MIKEIEIDDSFVVYFKVFNTRFSLAGHKVLEDDCMLSSVHSLEYKCLAFLNLGLEFFLFFIKLILL